VLSGDLEEWDEAHESVIGSLPYRRVHLWNNTLGKFR
jgi:hypothetical protein